MKTLKLFGHTYSVEYIKDWQDPTSCANIVSGTCTIKINADMPESRQEEALLHEIFEGINYHLEIDLEHNKLCAISEVLYGIIKDNDLFTKKEKK